MVSRYTMAIAVAAVASLVLCLLAIVPPSSIRSSLRSYERRFGAPPPTMLGAGAVSLLLTVVGIASSTTRGGEFGVADGLIVAGGVLGPLALATGLSDRAVHARFTAACDSRTGTPETGTIAVDGALTTVEETFTIPRNECKVLSCAYALQQRRGLITKSWVIIAEGERTAPLAIDDGSGPVRVDTDAVEIRAANQTGRSYSISLSEDDEVPDDVASFLAEMGVENPGQPNTDYRLRLRPLAPGETATAFGQYDRVTRENNTFWGITSGDEPAYLYPADRESVDTLLARRSRWLSGIGAVLTLVSGGYVAAQILPFL